jgi:hypothetical protein
VVRDDPMIAWGGLKVLRSRKTREAGRRGKGYTIPYQDFEDHGGGERNIKKQTHMSEGSLREASRVLGDA